MRSPSPSWARRTPVSGSYSTAGRWPRLHSPGSGAVGGREEGEREEGEKEEGKMEEGEREGGKREGGRRKERGGRGRKGKGSRPRSARAPPDMTVSKLEFGLNLVSETGSQPPVSSHPGLIHLMGWVEVT